MHIQFLIKEWKQDIYEVTEYMTVDTEIIFTQMSAKVGINCFQEQAVAAKWKESKNSTMEQCQENLFLEQSIQTGL